MDNSGDDRRALSLGDLERAEQAAVDASTNALTSMRAAAERCEDPEAALGRMVMQLATTMLANLFVGKELAVRRGILGDVANAAGSVADVTERIREGGPTPPGRMN